MSEPASFHSATLADGPRNRRNAGLAILLIVGFIGVAIAKPWGGAVEPAAPTPGPSSTAAAAVPSSAAALPSSSPTVSASPGPTAPGPARPLSSAFVTPVPPPVSAAWTGVRWRRLAPDDPLRLAQSVLRWPGGFVAVGGAASAAASTSPAGTAVWTSTDGARWEPLPFGTADTFWPGIAVRNVAAMRGGLVAVTELADPSFCSAGPRCLPVTSWTSSDGRAWTPRGFFSLGQPSSARPSFVAAGSAGLLAVSNGRPSQAAVSSDGTAWTPLPSGAFPKDIIVNDLRGTATGYVAGGLRVAPDAHWEAVTLWSADGRAWTSTTQRPPPTSPAAPPAGVGAQSSVVFSIVVGRHGMVAIGRGLARPGAELWWQSPDGRSWRPVTSYLPLGRTACAGVGCGTEANGALVGDGQRIVALRGGADAAAWTSSDGRVWQRLSVAGDLPTDQARPAVLLPGGVLATDGSTSWFGEAIVSPGAATPSPTR